MQIGRFHRVGDVYVGRLQTALLDVPLRLVPIAERASDKAPDWRVHLDGDEPALEVGSGWTHPREGGGSFITVQIDCPSLAQPLRANLLPSRDGEDQYLLLWSRVPRRAREQ
ncbi:MAG: DUF736 domain-containing protein [Sphingomonas sp.]|jgi:uncharacterized protein (DUF736 family)|uniref:DUF736 domain-containing protein n=1 Tax=Alphaproteobacteria TaxID=28211 RepID=UPI001AE25F68|nr:DUF736 family protein [Sphingomonas sp. BE137]MDR6849938.1 uncharacterized protein (DUF736 family) [Sphingomonas sp. BE137]